MVEKNFGGGLELLDRTIRLGWRGGSLFAGRWERQTGTCERKTYMCVCMHEMTDGELMRWDRGCRGLLTSGIQEEGVALVVVRGFSMRSLFLSLSRSLFLSLIHIILFLSCSLAHSLSLFFSLCLCFPNISMMGSMEHEEERVLPLLV